MLRHTSVHPCACLYTCLIYLCVHKSLHMSTHRCRSLMSERSLEPITRASRRMPFTCPPHPADLPPAATCHRRATCPHHSLMAEEPTCPMQLACSIHATYYVVCVAMHTTYMWPCTHNIHVVCTHNIHVGDMYSTCSIQAARRGKHAAGMQCTSSAQWQVRAACV